MSLSSSKNIRIVNNTDYPADFEWKSYSTDKEEKDKKNKLLSDLEEEEMQELLNIDPEVLSTDNESLDSDDS